jgi:hypothetical protein
MQTVDIVRAPPSLEELTQKWRAIARYGITKHGLGADGYTRVTTLLAEYTGLTYDEAVSISAKLSHEAHVAAGSPASDWGVTKYFPKLETPAPERWKPKTAVTGSVIEQA